MRKWGHEAPTESDMAALDFSSHDAIDSNATVSASGLIDANSMGKRDKDGTYEIQDWEYQADENDAISQAIEIGSSKKESPKSALGTMGSLFARFTGGKTLTEADLQPVLTVMKVHLMKKNVAKGIADKVCDGVGKAMMGKKITGYQCQFHLPRHKPYL
jgi:signal recognition particle receptor subunit alpha